MELEKMNKLKFLSLIGMITGLYLVLMYVFQSISFLSIQCRIAESLRVFCIFPFGIIGTLLGQFLGNLTSPLGLIDWISPIINIVGTLAIYFFHKKFKFKGLLLGLLIYCLGISLWVDIMLHLVYYLPLFMNFPFILIGECISVFGIGLPLYKVIKNIEIFY